MEKRKYTARPIKQITNAKDLENLKVLEKIKLSYYSDPANSPMDKDFPSTIQGIFGGSFKVNNETYLVLSDISDSKTFSSMYKLTSSLYKLDSEDELIINQMDVIRDYHSKGSPKSKNKDLESAIRGHAMKFTNTMKSITNKDNKQNTEQNTQ